MPALGSKVRGGSLASLRIAGFLMLLAMTLLIQIMSGSASFMQCVAKRASLGVLCSLQEHGIN
ncbi:MAG: hypothetical protein K2K75_11545 [Muribaculaceae bacterium]|nr:hypothetical protein [Muribaculaceae bacterium]